uniref:DOMON domain-containing protein n=1 Tax=Steinernema glaseri TaxID=37863 RepID=A0A1I7ZPR1_9BILA
MVRREVALKPLWLLVAPVLLSVYGLAEEMSRAGCGETKGCLFKPAGCNPNLDCTIAIVFFVDAPNSLRVQLVAQSILPPVPLQYIAIAFSHDAQMGDDAVTECVLGSSGSFGAGEPEVFVSYNRGKANDRVYLNQTESGILVKNIEGGIEDGRLTCQFSQQIIPQMSSKGGQIWPLNHKYFIMGATGSAQPDEVNVHDTNLGSHFYPIVSARPINPSLIGEKLYDLPPRFVEPVTTTTPVPTTRPVREESSASVSLLPSLLILLASVLIY